MALAHRLRGDAALLGQARQRASLRQRVAPRVLDGVEDLLVAVLHALEEVDRLQQLREAVGLQHDRDDVRLAARVAPAQDLRELRPRGSQARAQAQRALALAVSPLHRRGEHALGGGELGLHGGDALLQDRHLTRGRALQTSQARHAAGQRPLAVSL